MIRALVLVVIGGCYSPAEVSRCEVRCGDNDDCPGDLFCDTDFVCNTRGALTCSDELPPNACLTDRFDAFDTSRWQFTASSQVGLPAAPFGTLVMQIDPMDVGDGKVTSVPTFDLTGSQIQIEIIQPPENGLGNTAVTFGVVDPTGAGFTFEVRDTNVFGTEVMAGGEAGNQSQVAFDPLRHRHVRIAHAGQNLAIETSPDRSAGSWVLFTTMDTSKLDITRLRVELGLRRTLADTIPRPMFAELDNFAYITPGCTEVPIPKQALRDSFDQGASTEHDLADHVADLGGPWTNETVVLPSPIFVRMGGFVEHPNASTEGFYLAATNTADADYEVEANFALKSSGDTARGGLVGRGGSGENGYAGIWSTAATSPASAFGAASFLILKFDSVQGNASVATCGGFEVLPNQTHRLRLRMRGNDLSLFFDGQLVCSGSDMTATPIGTAGRAGLFLTGNDDFDVDDLLVTPL